jgi:hypothetical protein
MANTDAIAQLAATINRLSNLSNDPSVQGTPQQQKILDQVHSLSGDLLKLLTQQLEASDAGYDGLMKDLASVTDALNQAEAAIEDIVTTTEGAAAVASAIDQVIQQGVQLVASAAKFAA